MPIFDFSVKRRKRSLASVVFTPPSLDLDPGEVGVVVVSGRDSQGREVPIALRGVAPVPGLSVVQDGTQVIVTASPEGPVEDESLTVMVEVV